MEKKQRSDLAGLVRLSAIHVLIPAGNTEPDDGFGEIFGMSAPRVGKRSKEELGA